MYFVEREQLVFGGVGRWKKRGKVKESKKKKWFCPVVGGFFIFQSVMMITEKIRYYKITKKGKIIEFIS